MSTIYIKNGRTINDEAIEILIQDKKIEKISTKFEGNVTADKTVDLKGESIVSAGWIDGHTHCYDDMELYGDDPDKIGYSTGVTTVIDAGTTGADNIGDFYKKAKDSKTNVFAYLNISKTGIVAQNELGDLRNINKELVKEKLKEFPDFIVGIKARISRSVVDGNGVIPLVEAKKIQKENNNLPLMVHVGSEPPKLKDILDQLDQGDILTHCYNGKSNGILNEDKEIKDFVGEAYKRGIIFDIGHGTDSFNFNTAEMAKDHQLIPYTLSTDIYRRNRSEGPVYDFPTTIEKMLALGYSMEEILPMITSHPAEIINLKNKGQLKEGYDADITIFKLKKADKKLVDSNGNIKNTKTVVQPTYTIVEGNLYNLGE